MESLKPNKADRAASYLLSAFVWNESPEGHEYWSEVYKKLCAMAGVEPFYHDEDTEPCD